MEKIILITIIEKNVLLNIIMVINIIVFVFQIIILLGIKLKE